MTHRLPRRGERALQAVQQALRARDRGALGADGWQDDEMLTVTHESRQQAGTQERGFARSGSTQNDKELFDIALAHQAHLVDGTHDGGLSPEEDRGVHLFQGAQSRVGRSVRLAFGRPHECRCVQPRLLQATRQRLQPGAREAHHRFAHKRQPGHGERHRIVGVRQVADLPLGGHLLGQLREGNRLDDDTEDAFAEVLRLEELGEAILGVPPRRRDKKDHRFATIHRTGQGGHPTLARLQCRGCHRCRESSRSSPWSRASLPAPGRPRC